ncbi:MAG: RNA polymerase sigma factor [Isosphaeraceae bacterium]
MHPQRLAMPDLVRLFDTGSVASLSEWQLLERFVAHRDELAFEALVSRHGPMVLGICRRMLGNSQDVDDAFQATFLVLLKRAGSLGPGDAIAAWLHGVAVKVARQARSTAFRRRQRERTGIAFDVPSPDPVIDDPELRRVIDEEINRLPSKYRAPIVLCYLEGQTHEEAARQLDWPLGTVKGRLARARAQLESRLARRGLACGTALAALAAGTRSQAAFSGPLVAATCRAAVRLGTGKLTAHIVSASIVRLAQGVLTTMMIQKMKWIAVCAVASGLFLTSAGVLARQQAGKAKEPVKAELLPAQAKTPRPKPAPTAPPTQPGTKLGPGQDAKSQAIIARLEQPVAMSFPNETPLEDILKYIKQATQGPKDSGIPIYVDPLGLQEADKTLTSPVSLDLEHVPLRRTLQLALSQLGLIYFVDDGILVITSEQSEDKGLPPSRPEPAPFLQKTEKFERGEMTPMELKAFLEELKMRKEIAKVRKEIEEIEHTTQRKGIQ